LFLRGTRNYVQGTQIIARSTDHLPAGSWFLSSAKFSSITANLVEFHDQPHAREIGLVQFASPDGEHHALTVVETDTPAPRRDEPMPVQCRPAAGGDEDGKSVAYDFSEAGDFEDLLNAFVIAIKAEHVRRFAGAADIWFTGLRGGDLSVSDPPARGRLSLTLMRQLAGEPAHQTLWRADLRDAAGQSVGRSAITFSYVPGQA
jgi:hypothetical protein